MSFLKLKRLDDHAILEMMSRVPSKSSRANSAGGSTTGLSGRVSLDVELEAASLGKIEHFVDRGRAPYPPEQVAGPGTSVRRAPQSCSRSLCEREPVNRSAHVAGPGRYRG